MLLLGKFPASGDLHHVYHKCCHTLYSLCSMQSRPTAARVCEDVSSGTYKPVCSAHSLVSVCRPLNHAQLLQRTRTCHFLELTMDDVVNSSVRTEVMSWKRRELAAPDSRAPLLLSLMACSSPASRLMRMTLSALRQHVAVQCEPWQCANPGTVCKPLKDKVTGTMCESYHPKRP